MDLRPVDFKWFFVSYNDAKCFRQKVGVNKIGAMPKEIASFLRLPEPESYTGHCFRRASAAILVDSAPKSDVKTNVTDNNITVINVNINPTPIIVYDNCNNLSK